jgi:hypothetical protein
MSAGFPSFLSWCSGPERGEIVPTGDFISFGNARFDSDPLGNCNVTLLNCVVNSRYRIEISSTGALVNEGTIANATTVIAVPYYVDGNAGNDLKIKVRKASSAPKYQPFETFTTASIFGSVVYVSQVPDTIA